MASVQDKTHQRVSYARTLLEHNVKNSHACSMLQARFGISRSRAYELIKDAHEELMADKDAYTEKEDGPLDVDSLQGQLVYLISIKAAEGDMKAVAQGVKALDSILGWNGRKATLQGSHATGYCE